MWATFSPETGGIQRYGERKVYAPYDKLGLSMKNRVQDASSAQGIRKMQIGFPHTVIYS